MPKEILLAINRWILAAVVGVLYRTLRYHARAIWEVWARPRAALKHSTILFSIAPWATLYVGQAWFAHLWMSRTFHSLSGRLRPASFGSIRPVILSTPPHSRTAIHGRRVQRSGSIEPLADMRTP